MTGRPISGSRSSRSPTWPEGAGRYRQCARFVADHAQEIANARPVMPPNLNDREADFWEPLVAIADVAGGRWPISAVRTVRRRPCPRDCQCATGDATKLE